MDDINKWHFIPVIAKEWTENPNTACWSESCIKKKFKKELLGLPDFWLYSVFSIAFLSGCVVDCSFAAVVKNADAGEDWAASLLIHIFISAGVTGTTEACVSPYACSQVSCNLLQLWDLLKWPAEFQWREGTKGRQDTPKQPKSRPFLPAQAAPVGQRHPFSALTATLYAWLLQKVMDITVHC